MQKDNIITLLLSVITSVVISVLLAAAVCGGKAPVANENTAGVVEANGNALDAAAVNQAIENFLKENPEKIQEALNLAAQKEQEEAEKRVAELYTKYWKELSTSKAAPFKGPKNAKITIVEFFDFNCGYCKRLVPELMKVMKDNKDVKFVFQPVTFLGSMPIAKAALAANTKGKFVEVYEALMTHEGRVDNKVIENTFKKFSLNVDEMKKVMESKEITSELDTIRQLSQKIEIRGVPTLIINGKPLQAMSSASIQNVIDSLK